MSTSIRASVRCAAVALVFSTSFLAPASAQRANMLQNGSVEDGVVTVGPFAWTTQVFEPGASLTWDLDAAHEGTHSIKTSAPLPNDTAWVQTVSLEPNTNDLLSGWIKTENVEQTHDGVDAGANLCLYGTFDHTPAITGTTDWTQVRMAFNSGPTGSITIGARLGFWADVTSGTAWFDDIRVTEIKPADPHPR